MILTSIFIWFWFFAPSCGSITIFLCLADHGLFPIVSSGGRKSRGLSLNWKPLDSHLDRATNQNARLSLLLPRQPLSALDYTRRRPRGAITHPQHGNNHQWPDATPVKAKAQVLRFLRPVCLLNYPEEFFLLLDIFEISTQLLLRILRKFCYANYPY